MDVVGRRVARGGFIVFMRDVVVSLIALVGSIVVARTLGPEEYGLASIALIYPGVVVALASLGLGQALIRFSSAESVRGRVSGYIYSGLMVTVSTAVVSSLVVLVFASFFAELLGRPGLSLGIRVLSLYVLAVTLYSAFEAAFLGLGGYLDTAIASLVVAVTRVSIAVPLALLGFGYTSVLWGLSVGYLVGVALYLALLLKRVPPSRPSFGRAWELLQYSLPLYIPTLIASPINQVVMGFLALRASNFEMGNLSVAGLLLTPIGILGGALSVAVFSSVPLLLDSDSRLREAVNKAVLYTNMIVVPLALGLAVVSRPLTELIYGPSYTLTPLYLTLLLIPYIFQAIPASTVTLYANTIGDTRFTGAIAIVDTAVRAPTAILLINEYGTLGYLVTPIIVNPPIALATILLGRRRYNLTPWMRKNASIALWTLLAFTPAITLSLKASWLLGALVYTAILTVTAKIFIEKRDAEELIEISTSIPIIGNIIKHIGGIIIKKLW